MNDDLQELVKALIRQGATEAEIARAIKEHDAPAADAKPGLAGYGKMRDMGREFFAGMLPGVSARLEAGVRAIGPETYGEALKEIQGERRAYQQEHPVQSLVAAGLGGAPLALATGGAGVAPTAARGATLINRAGQAMKAGAKTGALFGAAEGSYGGVDRGAGGAIEGAIKGGLVGGVAGGVLSPVAALASAGASKAANAVQRRLAPAASSPRQAANWALGRSDGGQEMLERWATSRGVEVDDLLKTLQRATGAATPDDPRILADLGPEAGRLLRGDGLNNPTIGRDIQNKVVRARSGKTATRVLGRLAQEMGITPEDALAKADDILAMRSANAAKNYAPALNHPDVDRSGPVVRLYHGSPREFDRFDPSFATPTGLGGKAVYFTDDPKLAAAYGANVKAVEVPRSQILNLDTTPQPPNGTRGGEIDDWIQSMGYQGTFNPSTGEYTLYSPNNYLDAGKPRQVADPAVLKLYAEMQEAFPEALAAGRESQDLAYRAAGRELPRRGPGKSAELIASAKAQGFSDEVIAMMGLTDDTPRPTVEDLHYFKQGVDRTIKARQRAAENKVPLAGSDVKNAGEMQRQLLDALDAAVPEYGVARKQFADETRLAEALEAGREAFKSAKVTGRDVTRAMSELSTDAEREMFRLGAFDAMREVSNTSGVGDEGLRSLFGVKLGTGTIQRPDRLEKARSLFANGERFTDFDQYLRKEIAGAETSSLANNSQTAEKFQDLRQSEFSAPGVTGLVQGTPERAASDELVAALRRRLSRGVTQRAGERGQILLKSAGGADITEILTEMAKERARRASAQRTSRVTAPALQGLLTGLASGREAR